MFLQAMAPKRSRGGNPKPKGMATAMEDSEGNPKPKGRGMAMEVSEAWSHFGGTPEF